jgi:hypothetical protein
MQIFRNTGEQDRRNAEQSFVLGERSLRAYLAGGNVRFLEDAESNFSVLDPKDRRYDDARFYLAVTKVQLRKADESIDILSKLRKRKATERIPNTDLENKIALQLAYAHIKKYTDEDYKAAEKELCDLRKVASDSENRELLVQTKAIQVFMYSVMAGRFGDKEKNPADFARRPDYARKALELGEDLLKTARSFIEVRFEALNSLGITWMWIAAGQWNAEPRWNELGEPLASCTKAQNYYDQALTIIPNSVRVLQNVTRLRLLQVKHDFPKDRSVLLAEAKEYVLRSLEVNDQDQYPFYELAQIAVKQGDPKAAWENIHIGRTRPGAVKEKEWAKVEQDANALAANVAPEAQTQA